MLELASDAKFGSDRALLELMPEWKGDSTEERIFRLTPKKRKRKCVYKVLQLLKLITKQV